jgi:DNA-binding HxlR family transcriptional regulator
MRSPKEAELQQRVFQNIASLLGVPDASFQPDETPQATLGFSGTLSVRGHQIRVLGEVEAVGQPWAIRAAIHRLSEHRTQNPEHLPLLVSELIGPRGRALCKQHTIAYVDLLGNSYLEWAGLYIDKARDGTSPRTPKRARSLFSDKASLVIRAALDDPGRPLQVREVARELGLSPAWVSQVLRRLISAGYAARVGDGTVISRPLDLLADWAESYRFMSRNDSRSYFCEAPTPQQVIARVASLRADAVGTYALTLHAGASLVAPFAEFHEVHIYVDPYHMREEIESQWTKALGLRPVEAGGNLYLAWPYYKEGAFYGKRQINGVWVASDVQLYVDLYNYPMRGREQAEYLLRNRLAHLRSQA